MDSKDGAAVTERSYEEFQPKITWKLEECPVYELTVPDFKKEHLNVKLDQAEGILKINGERPLGGNRWQQFSKTIPVSKDSKIHDFNAKLSNGILRIALPRTVTELDGPPQKQQLSTPTTTKTNAQEEKTTSDVGSDDTENKATKLGDLMKADSTTTTTNGVSKDRDDIGDDHKGKEGNGIKDESVNGGGGDGASGDEDGLVSDDDDHHQQQYSSGVARLRRPRWVVTVIVVVIAVVLIGAYTRFMLRTLSGEDDHEGEL